MCAIVTAPTRTRRGELNAAGVRVDPNLTDANRRGLQHPAKQRQPGSRHPQSPLHHRVAAKIKLYCKHNR